MSLPGLDLWHWESNLSVTERRQKLTYFEGEAELGCGRNSTRVPIGTVAAYYKDYVSKQGLDKYFRWWALPFVLKSRLLTDNLFSRYAF